MKKQFYKDIYKIKKSILPTVFLNALLCAAEPFIFVYISGYLLKFIIEAREYPLHFTILKTSLKTIS